MHRTQIRSNGLPLCQLFFNGAVLGRKPLAVAFEALSHTVEVVRQAINPPTRASAIFRGRTITRAGKFAVKRAQEKIEAAHRLARFLYASMMAAKATVMSVIIIITATTAARGHCWPALVVSMIRIGIVGGLEPPR